MNGKVFSGRLSILIILLMIISCDVLSQRTEQIVASSSGKYCRVMVSEYKQKYDTLEINLRVEWINENLQPVPDIKSKLLLRKDHVRTSAEGKIKYLDFEQQDYIAFNRSWPFRLLVNEEFTGTSLNIDFNFEIDDSQNTDKKISSGGQLLFKTPYELSCVATIDLKQLARAKNLPPEIRLIAPKADAEGRLVVKDAEIDI